MTLRRHSPRQHRLGYDRDKHLEWRSAVLRRDGRKCQFPGCNCKKKLQAHHIRRWADCPTIRYDVNNGITLCKKHHEFIKDKEVSYAPIFLTKVLQCQQKKSALKSSGTRENKTGGRSQGLK